MLPATPNEEEWIASRFIDLLNNERICANAQTLITGNRITAIAQERAEELAENYSHYRPNGASGITIYNDYQYGVCFDWTQIPGMEEYGIEYKPSLSGEDIACIGSANGTADNIAKRLVQAFRTSHSHWTDLLKTDYSAAGVGVRFVEKEDGTYKVYVAVLLIDRLYE